MTKDELWQQYLELRTLRNETLMSESSPKNDARQNSIESCWVSILRGYPKDKNNIDEPGLKVVQ